MSNTDKVTVEGYLITEHDYDGSAEYVKVPTPDGAFDSCSLEGLVESLGRKADFDFSVPLAGTVSNYGRVRVTLELLEPPVEPRAVIARIGSKRWVLKDTPSDLELITETLAEARSAARRQLGLVGFRQVSPGHYESIEGLA